MACSQRSPCSCRPGRCSPAAHRVKSPGVASYAGGYALWLAYGLSSGNVPLIVVDAIGLPCAGLTLAVDLSLRGSLVHPAAWTSCNAISVSGEGTTSLRLPRPAQERSHAADRTRPEISRPSVRTLPIVIVTAHRSSSSARHSYCKVEERSACISAATCARVSLRSPRRVIQQASHRRTTVTPMGRACVYSIDTTAATAATPTVAAAVDHRMGLSAVLTAHGLRRQAGTP
jgi:hypothetical protein